MYDIEETMRKVNQLMTHILTASALVASTKFRILTDAEKTTILTEKRAAVQLMTELLLPFEPDAKVKNPLKQAKK